ncbi:TPA: head completion/stabilization protein [Proteus mirabilis]
MERYRDIDTTAQGNKKADTMTPVIDEVWRDGKWALQRIKGETHNTVELI